MECDEEELAKIVENIKTLRAKFEGVPNSTAVH